MQKLWKAQTLVTSFAILSALLLLSMSASFNAKHLRLGVEASRAPNALIELKVKVDIVGIGSLSDQSRPASMIISWGSTVAFP